MKIRERILRKVFPEVYEQLDKAADIVATYLMLKESLKITDGTIKIEGPAGILGDLVNCKVKIAPKIHTEVVLSKWELEAMLRVAGEKQTVTSCIFQNKASPEGRGEESNKGGD